MRVSDSKRVLFVHVQKTGGSTIDAMLDREVSDSRTIEGCLHHRHASLRKILRQEPRLRNYWICGFVRNPWARMVSWWSMVQDVITRAAGGDSECQQRMKDNPNFWEPAKTYEDFEAFLFRGTDELTRLRKPQLDMLHAPRREADFIGRIETFAADTAVIRTKLGLPPLDELPRENTSPHGDHREYYTASTRRRVDELYRRDIETFGYRF